MKELTAGFALALCACVGSAGPTVHAPGMEAQTPWTRVSAFSGFEADDYSGLERMTQAYPDSGSVRLRMLNAQLERGDKEAVLDSLRWLKERGYVFSETAREQLPGMVDETRQGNVAALLSLPPEPIERSTVIATVPAQAGLVESVLMDLDGGNIAVTSVSGRSLWGKGPDADWASVPVGEPGNLSGIVWDPTRRMIWAASGQIDGSDDSMFSGLVGIRYPGDAPRWLAAPDGVQLSDLHRASDGTIYASDPLGGGVFMLRPDGDAIETLVPSGTFRSPQGITTSADNRHLYLSDYRYGLAAVELESRRILRITVTLPVLLDGIDGLWRHDDELIAVQNGTNPMRIVALKLSPDGLAVIGQRILERAHSEWTEPLSGYLGRGSLYYVGNGQWDRFANGVPIAGRTVEPTQIRRLSVGR